MSVHSFPRCAAMPLAATLAILTIGPAMAQQKRDLFFWLHEINSKNRVDYVGNE